MLCSQNVQFKKDINVNYMLHIAKEPEPGLCKTCELFLNVLYIGTSHKLGLYNSSDAKVLMGRQK